MLKDDLIDNFYKSLKIAVVLTFLSPFMGYLRFPALDLGVSVLPIPLQLIRFFIIYFSVFFLGSTIFGIIKILGRRISGKKKI